ncbi:MAG TPA: SDR family oxidoreductase [Acidimicrobiia bacterium]|jgi:NAD(P)-dependent dehydrogenase (short-subunit alcohol dehydrogenase family)
MGTLNGRVAVITGAGRGIGREHALLFAREGAKVVVNDLGGKEDGTGADQGPAHEVVDEIKAMGGEAVANTDNVADWEGGQRLVQAALDAFGELHVLVNNAGILRDRMLTNMTEEEWDSVIKVHLKGHFVPLHFAAVHWRELAKAGNPVKAAVVNTSSTSGLFGNAGQTNYGAAKTGIATLSIIAQMELDRYGVRVNAIAPAAMTRLIQTIPGVEDRPRPKEGEFNRMDPGNVSPFVAYLATEDCPIKGKVFFVAGGEVALFEPFTLVDRITKDGRWTVEELQKEAARFADVEFDYGRS